MASAKSSIPIHLVFVMILCIANTSLVSSDEALSFSRVPPFVQKNNIKGIEECHAAFWAIGPCFDDLVKSRTGGALPKGDGPPGTGGGAAPVPGGGASSAVGGGEVLEVGGGLPGTGGGLPGVGGRLPGTGGGLPGVGGGLPGIGGGIPGIGGGIPGIGGGLPGVGGGLPGIGGGLPGIGGGHVVGPDCCKAMTGIKKACESLGVPHPIFTFLLDKHCPPK